MYWKQNRSTEGCSKLTRSVDMTSSGKNGLNIRTNASPKWEGPGVRRSNCPLLASRTRCNVLWKPPKLGNKRKRKRSDSVLWQKPLHQQKRQKGKVTTQTTPQKSSITRWLRTDLGRSVGVTTATQLVWLTWFTGPTFPFPATAV